MQTSITEVAEPCLHSLIYTHTRAWSSSAFGKSTINEI